MSGALERRELISSHIPFDQQSCIGQSFKKFPELASMSTNGKLEWDFFKNDISGEAVSKARARLTEVFPQSDYFTPAKIFVERERLARAKDERGVQLKKLAENQNVLHETMRQQSLLVAVIDREMMEKAMQSNDYVLNKYGWDILNFNLPLDYWLVIKGDDQICTLYDFNSLFASYPREIREIVIQDRADWLEESIIDNTQSHLIMHRSTPQEYLQFDNVEEKLLAEDDITGALTDLKFVFNFLKGVEDNESLDFHLRVRKYFREVKAKIFGSDDSPSMWDYINHLSSCAGLSEETRSAYNELLLVYRELYYRLEDELKEGFDERIIEIPDFCQNPYCLTEEGLGSTQEEVEETQINIILERRKDFKQFL